MTETTTNPMNETITDPLGRTILVETNDDGTFTYSLGGYRVTLHAADREAADSLAFEQFAGYTP